jgi:hypothetical protein
MNPRKKNSRPDDMKSKIRPPRITRRRCPARMLDPSLSPREILRAVYESSSMITRIGTRGRRVPAGTNSPKYSSLKL